MCRINVSTTAPLSLTPSSPTKIQGNVSQVYFNSNNLSLQDRILQCSAILLKWGIFTVKWGGGIFTEIIFTVNMPPLKISLTKTGKTMLFFYI